jgi:hypothetical protein
MGNAQQSSANSAETASTSLDECTGLSRIDDSFYTVSSWGDGVEHSGKLVDDIIGDCLVKQHTIPLESQRQLLLNHIDVLKNASIRSIELVFPKAAEVNGDGDWLKRLWTSYLIVGGTEHFTFHVANLKMMLQVQPSLVSEDMENRYVRIVTLQEWPLFMNKYHDVSLNVIYKESGLPLSVRITYCDLPEERATALKEQYGATYLATPFLTPLTEYRQRDPTLVSLPVYYKDVAGCKSSSASHYEAQIPVNPLTTSIFISAEKLDLGGAEAIFCGVKLPIHRHTARIYSITFDPKQTQEPFTPQRHYRYVANSSKMVRYITLRSKEPIFANLRFVQANMLITRDGLTGPWYSKEENC